jgi:hypothetical protein
VPEVGPNHYSLRYPYKVATSQKRPKGFLRYLSDDTQKYHSEESIKHYFAYKHYHNINGFYDDYRFLRAGKPWLILSVSTAKKYGNNIPLGGNGSVP